MTWIDSQDPDDRMPGYASGRQVDCLSTERDSISLPGAKEERVKARPLHRGSDSALMLDGASRTRHAVVGRVFCGFESRRSAHDAYTEPHEAATVYASDTELVR